MISYSDATVTAPNHHLIMRSNVLLATTHATVHNCRGCFVIKLHLILLISGQNQTRPMCGDNWAVHLGLLWRAAQAQPRQCYTFFEVFFIFLF
jgi:hypothetical protein